MPEDRGRDEEGADASGEDHADASGEERADASGEDHADASDRERSASADDPASAKPPRVVLADALSPVRDLLSRGAPALGLPEPTVLAADVQSLPPRERFETAATRHADRLGVDALDADGLDAAARNVPIEAPLERATTFLARRSGRLQGELLAQLARDPEHPRDHLVLAVAARHLQRVAIDLQVAVDTATAGEGTASEGTAGADAAGEGTASEGSAGADAAGEGTGDDPAVDLDVEILANVAVALSARLFDLVADALEDPTASDTTTAAREGPLPDAVVRDVALAETYRTRARGDAPSFDPLDRDPRDLRELVVVQGASLAITELDADPAAIAALVDVPLEHVVGVLASDAD